MSITEDYSLLNKKLDPTSSFWKKKYTLLLKRAENVEKQNLRLINRLYQIKKIKYRLTKEKKFLTKRLDKHNDDFRNTKFYIDSELLSEGASNGIKRVAATSKSRQSSGTLAKTSSSKEHAQFGSPPKKPLNAFLRYCQFQRDKVTEENPGITHQELTKMLSRNWNTSDDSDKEKYYEMFDQDRLRYEKELQIYKNKTKQEIDVKNKQSPSTGKKKKETSSMEQTGSNSSKKIHESSAIEVTVPSSVSVLAASNESAPSDGEDTEIRPREIEKNS